MRVLLRTTAAWLLSHWATLAFVSSSLLLFVWVGSDAFGARIVTTSQGADYWEHTGNLRVLLDHPLRPENPHLVSPASSPRFVPPFLLAALLGKAFGVDALGAMGIASCVNMALLFAGIYVFFRGYFRDQRAPLYGLLVMFSSWYDAWHFSNVYQLKIFFSTVSYPSTAALGIALIAFSVTLRALHESVGYKWLVATALCLGALLITHPLTAMMGFAGAGLLAISHPNVPLRLRGKVVAAIILGALLSFAWPYFSIRGVLAGGSHEVSAIVNELSGGEADQGGRLHQFYSQDGLIRALGTALAGLPICLYLILRRRHWFISLGALAMLLPFVVNAYRPLPLGHRFILLAVFFLQVALVWLLLKLSRGAPEAWLFLTRGWRGWVSGAVVAASLLVPAWWNVEIASERLAAAQRRMGSAQESGNVRYARAVAELTQGRGVVLADARTSWPIPTFGPKVLVLLHPNPLVPDEPERGAAVGRFFSAATSEADRFAILKQYGVTHVVTRRGRTRGAGEFLSAHADRRALPAGYWLFTLRSAP